MPDKLSDKKRRISAALKRDLIQKAEFLAIRDGLTLTDIVSEALSEYVAKENEKSSKKKSNEKK